MAEQGSQLSVLQRVRNKNNIADMLYKKKIDQIRRETSLTMSKIEMEKLDCKSFLKTLRNCESDDMSEFAPLLSYTLGEDVGSAMKGRRTRFRDLFATETFNDQLPAVLNYQNIKHEGERHRYKDLNRSRTLVEMWTSKLNSSLDAPPQMQRAKTDIALGGDTGHRQTQEVPVNLSAGIITKMVGKAAEAKRSSFKKLPTPRNSISDTLPMINQNSSDMKRPAHDDANGAVANEAALPRIDVSPPEKQEDASMPSKQEHVLIKSKLHGGSKENLSNKSKKIKLHKKIEHFYQEIEPLLPKKESPRDDWLLPPL